MRKQQENVRSCMMSASVSVPAIVPLPNSTRAFRIHLAAHSTSHQVSLRLLFRRISFEFLLFATVNESYLSFFSSLSPAGNVLFENLEKDTEYDVFVRAKALQNKAKALNPAELLTGLFSSPVTNRTSEDGNAP